MTDEHTILCLNCQKARNIGWNQSSDGHEYIVYSKVHGVCIDWKHPCRKCPDYIPIENPERILQRGNGE